MARGLCPPRGSGPWQVGDNSLCYEAIGDPQAEHTVVLIMGLGLQMAWWRDDFCAELAGRGLRIVRFDNRDVGHSTRILGPGVSAFGFLRRRATATYSLGDMADDTAGLIEQVAPEGAHVVGVSLGSLIAQEVAIRHAARTVRIAIRRSMSRGPGDDSGRQLAAILNERDRRADLGRLQMPALVIHGDQDRIMQPSGGRATAAAIPGSELLEITGMGHDLARWTWRAVIDGIERTARRAGSPRMNP
ncbi:MAG: alpha/beta fold hydrolase [Geodermatophilaceae bacterium]